MASTQNISHDILYVKKTPNEQPKQIEKLFADLVQTQVLFISHLFCFVFPNTQIYCSSLKETVVWMFYFQDPSCI